VTQQQWGRPAQQPAWGQQQQPWGQGSGWGQPAPQRPAAPGYPSPQTPYAPYQNQPSPPQRSGGSPLKLLLLGLVAALAIGFFFLSLMNYLNSDEQSGPEPLPSPEVGQTSAPPTGVPEPDYDPPEPPAPVTWEEAEKWLVDNALYAQSVAVPTNCTLGRIDVATIAEPQLQEHLNLLTGCLMMVWQEPMERAGFQMPRPPISTYSQPITTACGEAELYNAFYCQGDQRIYYATNLHLVFERNNPEVIDNAFMVDYVIGHEFGHAIQGRTGILNAYIPFRSTAKTEDEGLELGRRSEQQADCLAGMFLNSVAQASQLTDAERTGLEDVAEAIGDDSLSGDPSYVSDHGTGKARRAWFGLGLQNAGAAVCNTWTAPSDQVR
jgi:predicted metalloprotease